MRPIRTRGAAALLLGVCVHAPSLAQQAPPQPQEQQAAPAMQQVMQQVRVSAGATDLRRQSTTTAIVIGREELLRQGDSSLSEVLKRQPGITVDAVPGRAPAIRMRGMGSGYVVILLGGVPAPSGFALESISPDLVERVEIQRVATAETSGQAVAGAINIILRKAGGGRDEIKAGSSVVGGYAAPSVVAQHNGKAGALDWTVIATLRRNVNPVSAADLEEGNAPALLRRTAWSDRQREDMLELAPRLNWKASPADTFSSQTFIRARRIDNLAAQQQTTEIGTPAEFQRATSRYRTQPLKAYLDGAWTRRLDGDASLSTKLIGSYTRSEADFLYRGMDGGGALLETHQVASGPVERQLLFNGSWRRPFGGGHALAAGWDFSQKRRSEYRREHQYDAAGTGLLATDESYRATVRRAALFIQDEWDLNAAWSAYLGLRRETLHTRGGGNAAVSVDVGAGVWSPILQTLYKLQPDAQGRSDQLRLAVGRSYKAPEITQLMPRRYTVDNNNSANNPDQQGNPNLRPELALNLDLAWERYFSKDSMLGISAFDKQIRDITLDRVYQSGGVWIVTPVNAGRARVRGLEFEAKATRGAVAGRANLARNWSRLEQVPGPDNRIDGQPAWTGNLGLDVAAGAKLDLGASASYRGRYASRESLTLAGSGSPKRQLDLYAVWKSGRHARLRLSANDLLHQDYTERSLYTDVDKGHRARSTVYRPHTTWRLMWEQSL
ncbi:TonB-dependent receptor plug domain-containing protein [Massilia phyllosphaerae]|uniref:TonB-dependent receptor plug domain-containing protein n=1 Tax=Massilia phyllosphaerae TaxID=3106034 RepID=UPI002B1CAD5C|nr:TonB-dependent receptor [Massilia sp. SGZ-792]